MKEYDEFRFNRLEERAWRLERELKARYSYKMVNSMAKKTIEISGNKFEVPDGQLYCKKCGTTNFIYDDMTPPYLCADCGKPLKADTKININSNEPQQKKD